MILENTLIKLKIKEYLTYNKTSFNRKNNIITHNFD